MPTKRTRRIHDRRPGANPIGLHFLSDGLFPMPDNATGEAFKWRFLMPDHDKAALFEECKDALLFEWTKHNAGTRPAAWWLYAAPEKCRQRLGGVGDPVFERLGYAERYDHGIPYRFIDQWSADYYQGRAGKAIDFENPPRYESQAAYLRRHNLLTATEKRALKPQDFEPEPVSSDED